MAEADGEKAPASGSNKNNGVGIAIGIAVGAVIGVIMFDDVAMGIAMGIPIGIVFGLLVFSKGKPGKASPDGS